MAEFSLHHFTDKKGVPDTATYVSALEAFDAIKGMQELKGLARSGLKKGQAVLDVGCGFGLESERLAASVGKEGRVTGIDINADFIDEAKKRSAAKSLAIRYQTGDANALPFADNSFDCVRAERLLIYLDDPAKAVRDMARVCKPGGLLAFIEPDFSTTTVNQADRIVARKALAYEVDHAVTQGWLPGPLNEILHAEGLRTVTIDTRIAILPQKLGGFYFEGVGKRAADAGALSVKEFDLWSAGLKALTESGTVFGSVSYFLFTAKA